MKEYKYFAFISYKREDEKWAKWLQRKLEAYRLPSVLQKQYKLDTQKLTPIFRDKTDLSTGTVRNALNKELQASKYLIVICSPRSAKSEWVDMETRSFIDNGRAEYILPFIIEGKPHADGSGAECYTRSMLALENQLLGVNVNEVGKSIAFLRIVSGLLNIHADDLIRREKRRQQKKFIFYSAIISALLIPAAYFFWLNFPTTQYFTDYVIRHNLPEGSFPLAKEQIKSREGSYRFTYRGGLLKKVEHVNSAGRPTAENDIERYDRPPVMQLEYGSYGRLKQIKYYNEYQVELLTIAYGNLNNFHEVMEFYNEGGNGEYEVSFLQSDCTAPGGLMGLHNPYDSNQYYPLSAIAQFELITDDGGRIESIKFLNKLRMPASDANGIYGVSYVYDQYDRVVAVSYNGIIGEPMANQSGCAGKKYVYEGANLTGITWHDLNGDLINNSQGYASCARQYDQNGNPVRESYLDYKGNPVKPFGFAAVEKRYDNSGNCVQLMYLDEAGQPVISPGGAAMINYRYDSSGKIVQVFYGGINGEPVQDLSGTFGMTLFYDESHQRIKELYVDKNGLAMANREGIAAKEYVWTIKRLAEIKFLNLNGNLAKNAQGFARVVYSINVLADGGPGSLIKYATSYDENGKVVNASPGFSTVARGFDKHKRLLFEAFYDSADKLVKGPHGYKMKTYKYDLLDNMTKEEYRGDDGSLAIGPLGYAKKIVWFNSENKPMSESFYDETNHLMSCANGYARALINYNDDGLETERAFYDKQGLPVLSSFGYARLTCEYYDGNAGYEMTYWGADGKPVNSRDGYAHYVRRIDEKTGKYAETYYDADGKKVATVR